MIPEFLLGIIIGWWGTYEYLTHRYFVIKEGQIEVKR